ncbi:glycerophosphodiester phosphodiesterase [Nakamurella deserti]|uniref:glycerophosphodiester phosphodiesterase n=1 Tax=Nakamurella deserti TaxID=2164074 RepID=UPI0013007CF3|nr:glycerophosphodiester phosphodiesterase family protein [Nakamurella deserti]
MPHPDAPTLWSRRTALRVGGTLGGLVGLSALLPRRASAAAGRAPVTVDGWRASWTEPVLVAHRGSGDTYPEHTMVAYQAAVDWGATAMEVSVGITSDGVLICMHDATYDRTTTGSGRIDAQPASVLDDIRVLQPQLGAYWVRNAPPVPLLEDVLDRFGGRLVLCLEAKNRAAYAPMMAAVVRRGLQRSVMVKVHHTSDVLALAAAEGYPRFAYLGSRDEVTETNIAALQTALDPARDVLVIAAGTGPAARPFVPDALVRRAVATGIPVWVFPLHRRSELRHFVDLGVRGAVCAGYGYLAGVVPPVVRDSWSRQRVAPGELALAVTTPPTWTADGELVLDLPGRAHFVMPGQFSSVASTDGRWSLDVDLRWREAPGADDDLLSVAFGHEDDRYYEHRGGIGTGYHATLRADGRLGLYLHRDRRVAGQQLAVTTTPAPVTGRWAHLRIEVTPTTVTVRRTDTGEVVRATDRTVRGGHLHLGRASRTGTAGFRALTVG